VNLNNSEVIFDQGIEERSVEVEIPDSVSTISLGVVPTTSKNVEGAQQIFQLQVPADTTSIVNFEDDDYSTNGIENVSVTLSEKRSFIVYDNGIQIYKSNINDPGTYDVQLELKDSGENVIEFYVVDEDNNMYSFTKTIILDTIGPSVSLVGDYSNYRTTANTISIEGTVTDFTSITANETLLDVATDGTFIADINLHLGINDIVITAVDDAGNETTYNLSIEMYEEEQNPIKVIAALGVLVAIILYFIISTFLKKKRGQEDDNDDKPSKFISKKEKNNNTKKDKKLAKKGVDVFEDSDNGFVNFIKAHKNETIIINSWIIGLFILFKFIIMLGNITSGSMEPTLMTGDICVYNRLAYVSKEPQRGDIINFVEKDSGELYSKRIIGIAGDTIEFYDGYVYLNGELLDESEYLEEDVDTKCLDTFTVPDNCVFVLGDNRENSKDSRYFSYHYIPIKDIRAKYIFTLPWF
ncbi:MAG: signal peptidase I, partial [Pseudobutyrivibrio sp.]|nr:signal peptidase I [Pseudobutyrivibrio sp.]